MTKTSTKLSYDDPWRYQCPQCGTHRGSIEVRVRTSGQAATRYGPMDDPEAPAYCNGCRDAIYDLYDKQIEETVSLGKREV